MTTFTTIVLPIIGMIWNFIITVLGYFFFVLIALALIGKIINNIKSKRLAKEAAEKIKQSNFMQEAFKPMTEQEKENLKNTGKSESVVNLNLNTNETTVSTPFYDKTKSLAYYLSNLGGGMKVGIGQKDSTGDKLLCEIELDSEYKYELSDEYKKYHNCKVIDGSGCEGAFFIYIDPNTVYTDRTEAETDEN